METDTLRYSSATILDKMKDVPSMVTPRTPSPWQTDLKGEGTFAEELPYRNAFCQCTQNWDSTELEKTALDTLVSSSTSQYLWGYSGFLISYSLSGLQNKVPHKNKA